MKLRLAAIMLLAALLLSSCSAEWKNGEVVVVQEEQKTIRILAGQSTSDAGSEGMIQRVLEEKFPDVEFQWICLDWGSGFAPQVTARFAAGEMPDILIGKAQDISVYKTLGAILPVPAEACGGVRPEALSQVMAEGVLYGLPYNTLYQGVLYNKAIFDSLGLAVPATREELANVVSECEAAGYTPFALHFGDTWSVGNLNMQFWMNDLFAKHPVWGKKDQFRANPLVSDAFEQCRYMLEHSYSDAAQISQVECLKRFAQGETAMFMTGTWSMQMLYQLNPDFETGLFPYPNTTGDSCLLEETNMTFMKGNTGKDSSLADQILLEIGRNDVLAREIAEFSASTSTFTSLTDSADLFMDTIGAPYEENGRIANVALGNDQFVWPFQNLLAERTLEWLGGKISLDQILDEAETLYKMY